VGRTTRDFFDLLDRGAIAAAIRTAEAKGRGEIRVHLHRGKVRDARAEAEKTFARLGMAKTELRSGCLVFVAPEERAFVVLGDEGIHRRAGDGFWEAARDAAAVHFLAGRVTEGLVAAVTLIGDELAKHFPWKTGEANPNELPDDVSES
jgi:uncharacterized membrane protein